MMHHPRPQHPLPPREVRYDLYEVHRNQYSFSRTTTSDVRNFDLPPHTPSYAEDSEMMVEPPQHVYSPPSLTRSENYGLPSTQRSPTTYQGFQSPPQNYQSRLPPQSPTFALRPAQSNNVFSHIEHPPAAGDQVDLVSSDDEDEYQTRAATPHHSRQPARTTSQSDYSYRYPAAYDSRSQEPFVIDPQLQMNRGMSQIVGSNPYALTRLSAPVELETPIGALRPVASHRPRGRNGSDSSIGSMLSDAAVVGSAIYRTDTYGPIGGRSKQQADTRFQPQSVPTVYPHEFSDTGRVIELQEQVPQTTKASAPNFGSSYMPPPSSQYGGAQEDHPFVYQGADWDFRARSLRSATATNTDADAMSLDPERRSSSRGSDTSSGRLKRDRNSARFESPASLNGDGKRKATMACHFCRFRKLRCDGRSPCGHCEKREQECKYDAIIRRRGPGRKNKSAQETARVQLAQRQREEADRESRIQSVKTKAQRGSSLVVAMEIEKRDVSMQTSPQTAQYPFSQVDGYRTQPDRHMTPSNQYTGYPSGNHTDIPQYPASSTNRITSAFPSPAEFEIQYPRDVPPPRPQERQGFTALYQYEQMKEVDSFPASLAHQQQSQPYSPQQYQGSARERLSYGLQTPVSTAPSSFFESPPDRSSSNQGQHMHSYGPNSYGHIQGHSSNRYQSDTHTDTDSVYAYSEGANVTPSRYGGHSHIPPAPRSDVQVSYARGATHREEAHAGASNTDRNWEKSLPKNVMRG